MNASGSLDEDDAAPIVLCPQDMQKMCISLDMTPKQYLSSVHSFVKAQRGFESDASLVAKCLAVV